LFKAGKSPSRCHIGLNQGAFIKGRLISHNIQLTQELLKTYNWKFAGMKSCFFKVDIQKAFDNLEWSFLLDLLAAFRFPQAFIISTLKKQLFMLAYFQL
jgi:hypothetical protein